MSETPETGQEVRGGCIERPTEGAMNCAGVRFVGVAFTDLADVASWLSFSGCEFIDCDFSRADLRHARLCGPVLKPGTGSRFHGCRFDAADIRDVYLVGADFENCSFKDVDLHGVHFKRNNLIGNRFAGIVDGLTIWGQEPEMPLHERPGPNRIFGNDFRDADLRGLGLRAGVPVDDQLWPSSGDIVILDRVPQRALEALNTLESHPDTQHVRYLRITLKRLAGRSEQKTQVLRIDDPAMPRAWPDVIAALRAAHPVD